VILGIRPHDFEEVSFARAGRPTIEVEAASVVGDAAVARRWSRVLEPLEGRMALAGVSLVFGPVDGYLALASATLGDREAAAEVVQDAFMALWRRAPQFDATAGSLLTWLLSIARHRAIDRLRAEGRRPLRDAASLDEMACTGAWDGAVLVIHSTDDVVAKPSEQARLRQAFPRAAWHEFPGAGHSAYSMSPPEYAEVVAWFVRRSSSG